MTKLNEKQMRLVKLCRPDSPDLFQVEDCLSTLTPNEVCETQDAHPDVDILGYPLWAVSATWGFECLWCDQHRRIAKGESLEPDEMVDAPDISKLTPDVPLGQHRQWAPQDHMRRIEV